jgi:ubiquinone/menaquinone biosynthesis C-methylase UbiE
MSESSTYVIRGGISGRERLRVLAGVMAPNTNHLLDRLGHLTGRRCLDAGCGGGDVTRELAQRVGPDGHVVGVDLDETKLALCREETSALGNIEFRAARIGEDDIAGPFDVVYSRFLLTHLPDPAAAVRQFHAVLPAGGQIALEDIDFSGYFTYPFSAAHARFADLYSRAVRSRGADPDIGPRLPLMLLQQGFTDIRVSVVQPMGLTGDVKLLTPMTAQSISEAVVGAGLASAEEVAALAQELYAEAANPATLSGCPRIVQVWARKI